MIRLAAKILFIIALVGLGVSYNKKDKLPDIKEISPLLYIHPDQDKTTAPPIEIEKKGLTYTVKPLRTYELYGLVVSQHDSRAFWDYYHDKWKDFLNVKDFCVIWGDNLKNTAYQKFKFRNGSWTCFYQTRDMAAYQQFDNSQLSNNHILSIDETLTEALLAVNVGDQIRLKGHLAIYSHNEGFKRGTSLRRDDAGGNACETILVDEFEVIGRANPLWNSIFSYSKFLFFMSICLFLMDFFFVPYRPYKKS